MAIGKVDVTICGGGPVGLLIAYCLSRYGVSTYVAEQHGKSKHEMYGRAAMLAPRTLEMLEQLDLEEQLGQIGFVTRGQSTYRNGRKVDKITYASSNITDTYFDYLLLVRQMHIEDVLRKGIKEFEKGSVHFGVTMTDYQLSNAQDDHPVLSTFQEGNKRIQVQSKYLVGADGSKSVVREIAKIPFEGSKINRHFIRIDGIVKTDLPDHRNGLVSIDSKSHGSVLWACLDEGRTRIGFAFPEKLYQEVGGNVTKEDIVREAKLALEPFALDFETVDWWTAYSAGQRLAADFSAYGRVYLAGDASHSHSSVAAQGLNVGCHDAVNLSWKLAGHIQGSFNDTVLESYPPERRAHALQVIEQDKLLSILQAGDLPDELKNQPDVDRAKLIDETYKANQGMNAGIGVAYPPSNPTLVPFSGLSVLAGERAPDALVQRPGIRVPLRLYTLFKNVGKFTIIAFCGNPAKTGTLVTAWRKYLDGPDSFTRLNDDLFQHLTIVHMPNEFSSTVENLGVSSFGRAYYDTDGSTHERYGVDPIKGMAVILRPDGTIGTACALNEVTKATEYFKGFLRKKAVIRPSQNGETHGLSVEALGEVDIQGPKGPYANGDNWGH